MNTRRTSSKMATVQGRGSRTQQAADGAMESSTAPSNTKKDAQLSFVIKGDCTLLNLAERHLQPLINLVDSELNLVVCEKATDDDDDEDDHLEFDPLDVSSLALVLFLRNRSDAECSWSKACDSLSSSPWRRQCSDHSMDVNAHDESSEEYYFLHQGLPLCLVQQVPHGPEHVQIMRYVAHHNWTDMVQLYELLLGQAASSYPSADYCVFTLQQAPGYDIQLGLKQLPKGMVPSGPQCTTLRIATGNLGNLVPLLPNPCHQLSRYLWSTLDLDGNSLQLLVNDSAEAHGEMQWHEFLETLGPTLELLSIEIENEATNSIEDIDLSEQFLSSANHRRHRKQKVKPQRKKYRRATPQHQWDSGFIDHGEVDDLCEDGSCLCQSDYGLHANKNCKGSKQGRSTDPRSLHVVHCPCEFCYSRAVGAGSRCSSEIVQHRQKASLSGRYSAAHIDRPMYPATHINASPYVSYNRTPHSYLATPHPFPSKANGKHRHGTRSRTDERPSSHQWCFSPTEESAASDTDHDISHASSDTLAQEGIMFDNNHRHHRSASNVSFDSTISSSTLCGSSPDVVCGSVSNVAYRGLHSNKHGVAGVGYSADGVVKQRSTPTALNVAGYHSPIRRYCGDRPNIENIRAVPELPDVTRTSEVQSPGEHIDTRIRQLNIQLQSSSVKDCTETGDANSDLHDRKHNLSFNQTKVCHPDKYLRSVTPQATKNNNCENSGASNTISSWNVSDSYENAKQKEYLTDNSSAAQNDMVDSANDRNIPLSLENHKPHTQLATNCYDQRSLVHGSVKWGSGSEVSARKHATVNVGDVGQDRLTTKSHNVTQQDQKQTSHTFNSNSLMHTVKKMNSSEGETLSIAGVSEMQQSSSNGTRQVSLSPESYLSQRAIFGSDKVKCESNVSTSKHCPGLNTAQTFESIGTRDDIPRDVGQWCIYKQFEKPQDAGFFI